MYSPIQDQYAEAANAWAEAGNNPDAFPDFETWVRLSREHDGENLVP